ncbi:murein hydrolase activator EnvC family protein [Gaetbulibacter saemankumensis]|uniref:murein hydrolase activator EnvC family protein n=1 Tax=Gaetbulibacter saemankumensis TaxID=311208 RepID=UPI00047F8812|nr:peptidoglycan DD-metalloendopeptidase family protein [Gaetbulibacter saemankumensis]
MKQYNAIHKVIVLFVVLCSCTFVVAQSSKQKELETRRQELRREIQKISALQAENKSKHQSELSVVTGLNYKISVLDNLIKVTNQQANLLTRNIDANQKKITALRDELKVLKEDYADMIVKSYKSKNEQSRIMFLLSSDNFKQAYKRLQYMKQYTEHQKQQGEEIKVKTAELQQTNASLLKQQEEKRKIIAENRKNQNELQLERNQHQALMKSIKKNLSKYAAEIRQKQREANKIDAEINRIIKAAIAKSNRKAGKSSSSSNFALTAEEKVLAANFVSNKGKLPWPVSRGYVTVGYGTQPHPLNRSLTIKSNGVRIATEKGADVRAVFSGEVIAIVSLKNVNPIVMVKHGNYITAYKNLSKVYVKEGQMVDTKQRLGTVFTNPANGESILSFIISKDGNTQNPASWIYKM